MKSRISVVAGTLASVLVLGTFAGCARHNAFYPDEATRTAINRENAVQRAEFAAMEAESDAIEAKSAAAAAQSPSSARPSTTPPNTPPETDWSDY